ncbi:hypothetical protein I316_04676 [Kwoniella heveanensis BCC8398]|uniref:Uncharacterized protein n=1 Tax=Kwoniella heveanensis BCC8398 TaxID=1296120 RepID=A0A1B9GRF4_9TREE|nr:hypothetical protein I316_04676 [Kwoniella heveanensis BCC8398]
MQRDQQWEGKLRLGTFGGPGHLSLDRATGLSGDAILVSSNMAWGPRTVYNAATPTFYGPGGVPVHVNHDRRSLHSLILAEFGAICQAPLNDLDRLVNHSVPDNISRNDDGTIIWKRPPRPPVYKPPKLRTFPSRVLAQREFLPNTIPWQHFPNSEFSSAQSEQQSDRQR